MTSPAGNNRGNNSSNNSGGNNNNVGTNRSRKGTIPIPVSVSLYNLFPASKEAAEQKKNKKWFRPEHAMSLLHQVRLEIVIAAPQSKTTLEEEGESSESSYGKHDKIVYSSETAFQVHPSWNHLEDCLEDYLAIDGYYDSETSQYRNMRLRIWLLNNNDKPEETWNEQSLSEEKEEAILHQKGGTSSEAAGADNHQQQQKIMSKKPLLDISIHPTKLSRLAKVPPRLPINSLILHFSDGSIRATRSLLELVGDQDGSHSDENLKDEFGRFGDDVFRTLDSVTPSKKPPASEDEYNIYHPTGDSGGGASSNSNSPEQSKDALTVSILTTQTSGRKISKQQQEFLALEGKFASTETNVIEQDESSDQEHLEKLIQLEEKGLEKELELLHQEKQALQSMMEKASTIETQIAKLKDDCEYEKEMCRQSEFYLEARQVKVLRDLRTLYPISILKSEDRYLIRDLRIPPDVHSGAVPEEELSAALGFLCHLVLLISRYLSVQLRYRVFFNSSRSAIQEDGAMVLPLFQARMVEREQLDRAMLLIHRNVECILKSCRLVYNPQEHILVNLKRLFDTIVDGLST